MTVTDVYRRTTSSGRKFERWVRVRCGCGRTTAMLAHTWLAAERSGRRITCGGPAHAAERAARQPRGATHPSARYAGAVPSSVWAHIRNNAERQRSKRARRGRSFAFTLTHEDLAALWERQSGRCAYTGRALLLSPTPGKTTASLDRVDPRRGYVLGNVHFIHKALNVMKRDFSERVFFRLARAVARQARRFSRGMSEDGTAESLAPLFRVAAAESPRRAGVPAWCLGCAKPGASAASVAQETPDREVLPPEHLEAVDSEKAASGRCYARARYRCRACDAGRTFVARVENVKSGNTRSCGCLATRARAAVRRPVAGVIGRTYWAEVQRNALVRGIAFELAPDAAWNQYLAQAGRCALSGWRIGFAGTRAGERRQTASLDRLDAGQGYAPGNVVWTHKMVNLSRRELSVAEFVGWCIAVANRVGASGIPHAKRSGTCATAPMTDLPLFVPNVPRTQSDHAGGATI